MHVSATETRSDASVARTKTPRQLEPMRSQESRREQLSRWNRSCKIVLDFDCSAKQPFEKLGNKSESVVLHSPELSVISWWSSGQAAWLTHRRTPL